MKQRMKKTISLLLALCMAALCAPPAFAADGFGTDGGIFWSYDDAAKTLTIKKNSSGAATGFMNDYGEFGMPWDQYRLSLRTVRIGDGVKSIGVNAFNSFHELESVSIPNSVTVIRDCAFNLCMKLTGITIPRRVTVITAKAFGFCSNLATVNYTGSEAQWKAIDFTRGEEDAFFETSADRVVNYYAGVEGAMNAIDDIGDVVYTAACKARIQAARAAYDRLSDYESTLVTNYAALTAAKATIDAIKTDAQLTAEEQLAADEAAFEAYKAEQLAAMDALAEEGDSDACVQLIADAKAAVEAMEYSEGRSLDENKALVDTLVTKLADDLAAQRAAEAAPVKPPKTKECPICGKIHNGPLYDVLLGEIHWWYNMLLLIIRSFG